MALAEDLRQAVLQAALQGKLTEQLETDSNVDEMLANIQVEKEKIIANKKIKKEKSLQKIREEDIPFDIPDNWKFAQLGEIALYLDAGKSPECIKENVVGDEWGVITTTAIQVNNFCENENKRLPKDFVINRDIKIEPNDILITRAGPMTRTGIMCLVENIQFNLLLSDKTVRVNIDNKNINKKFIVNAINAPCIRVQIINMMSGMDKQQVNISQEKMRKIIIPIPPIEEQQRIVDKINEIMPKIDEYEKIEKELEALKKEFPTNIKNALLQAAMQGKLTEQLESDSSVDELLASIQKEKEELIAQKKIKKEKFLLDITEEEIPFDIPENWRWVKLGNVGTLTRGSGIKRNEVTETGYPCIRYGELYTTYKIKFDVAVSHTSKEMFDRSQKVNKNDILMALTGENNFDIALALAYVGDETVAMGGDLTRWSNHHMNPLYLVYAMNSSYSIHKKSEMAKGDIIVHISNDKLSTILLPIPPIEEQNRIVEKLDTLLPLCEDLKE